MSVSRSIQERWWLIWPGRGGGTEIAETLFGFAREAVERMYSRARSEDIVPGVGDRERSILAGIRKNRKEQGLVLGIETGRDNITCRGE